MRRIVSTAVLLAAPFLASARAAAQDEGSRGTAAQETGGEGQGAQAIEPAVLEDTSAMDPNVVELLGELVADVRADPTSGAAHAELGLAYEANTMFLPAEAQYDAAVRLLPDKPEWLYRRGLMRSHMGDLEGAAEDLGAAAARLRNTPVIQARYGDVLRNLGRYEEARAAWAQAIAGEEHQPQLPKSAASRVGLAQVLLDLERYEEAEALCREALDLSPGYKHAHYTRGLALRELGREAEAHDELVRGMQAFPEFPLDPHWQKLLQYGRGYHRRMMGVENRLQGGDVAGATLELNEMLLKRPDDHFVLNLAARAALMRGEQELAKSLLDRSIEAEPDAPNTFIEYTALLLNEHGRVLQQIAAQGGPAAPANATLVPRLEELERELREKAQRAMDLAPQLGRAHYYAGLVQMQTAGNDPQKLQAALASLSTAARLGCTEPRFYLNLANAYSMAGRPREMVRYAELAVDQAPDDPYAMSFLVQAYASGDRKDALPAAAARLERVAGEDVAALQMAIRAYLTVGLYDEAESVAARIAELAPGRVDVQAFLQEVRNHIATQRAAAPPKTDDGGGGGGEPRGDGSAPERRP